MHEDCRRCAAGGVDTDNGALHLAVGSSVLPAGLGIPRAIATSTIPASLRVVPPSACMQRARSNVSTCCTTSPEDFAKVSVWCPLTPRSRSDRSRFTSSKAMFITVRYIPVGSEQRPTQASTFRSGSGRMGADRRERKGRCLRTTSRAPSVSQSARPSQSRLSLRPREDRA